MPNPFTESFRPSYERSASDYAAAMRQRLKMRAEEAERKRKERREKIERLREEAKQRKQELKAQEQALEERKKVTKALKVANIRLSSLQKKYGVSDNDIEYVMGLIEQNPNQTRTILKDLEKRYQPEEPPEPEKPRRLTESERKRQLINTAAQVLQSTGDEQAVLSQFSPADQAYLRRKRRAWNPRGWTLDRIRPEYETAVAMEDERVVTPERTEGGFLGRGGTTIPGDTASIEEFARQQGYGKYLGGQQPVQGMTAEELNQIISDAEERQATPEQLRAIESLERQLRQLENSLGIR